MGRFEDLCASLRAEPLFHASLGSKELFHSNFLAWFVDQHSDAARNAFLDWTSEDPSGVVSPTDREKRHLDLVVRLGGRGPLVIENKVFAPPDDAQLCEYAEDAASWSGDTTRFVLLSLSPPSWPAQSSTLGGRVWEYRSYGELASCLEDASARISDSYDRETVERYARITRILNELADGVAVHDVSGELVALPGDLRAPLKSIRLNDGFEKLRARSIAAVIRAHERTGASSPIEVNASYTRSTPLVEAFVRVSETDELGWQYQGSQFRLAARVTETSPWYGRGVAERSRREKHILETYPDWFDFDALGSYADLLKPVNTRRQFNGFDPDFVYRYRILAEPTVRELVELSAAAIRRAADMARGDR